MARPLSLKAPALQEGDLSYTGLSPVDAEPTRPVRDRVGARSQVADGCSGSARAVPTRHRGGQTVRPSFRDPVRHGEKARALLEDEEQVRPDIGVRKVLVAPRHDTQTERCTVTTAEGQSAELAELHRAEGRGHVELTLTAPGTQLSTVE